MSQAVGTAVATLGSRALFPALRPRVYLNHAAISPPSAPVQAAVQAALAGYAAEGVSRYPVEMERRARVRAAFGALLGADGSDIALLPNTSQGVVNIALCLPWRRGDRVLLFRGEFPTNVTPWQQAARRHGLELVWIDAEDMRADRDATLAKVAAEVAKGLRLIAVSAVQFQTGLRMPLAELGALCRDHPQTELFVDAIQAVGVVPLDVRALGVHYLTAGGHKWLMGPEGTGGLYVAPESAARLVPNVAAWLSHDESFSFLFEGAGHLRYDRPVVRTAAMVEGGAANVLGVAGLEASLGLIAQLGPAAIYRHVQAWHDAAESGLLARGWRSARSPHASGRSGILSVRPPSGATDAARGAPAWSTALSAHGVSCACPDGWLRLAPHWPNALDEVDVVLDAVDAISAAGLPQAP